MCIRDRLENLQKRSGELQSQLDSAKDSAARDQERYSTAVKQVDEWKEKYKLVEQQARDKDAAISKLKSEAGSQLQSKVAEVTKLTADFKKQRDQQVNELGQKTQIIDGLKKTQADKDKAHLAELQKKDGEIKSVKQQIAERERSLAELRSKSDDLARQIEASNTEIGQLKKTADRSASEYKQAQSELEKARLKVKELEPLSAKLAARESEYKLSLIHI